MSEQDPKRLLLGAEDDLRSLLEAGKSEAPGDRQLAMLAAKIGIAGLAGAGGAGAAGAAGGGASGAGAVGSKAAVSAGAAAVKTGLAVKIVSAVVVVSAVGAGTTVVVKKVAAPAVVETVAAPVGLVPVPSARATSTATSTSIPESIPQEDPFANIAPSASVKVARAPVPSASAEEGPDELKLLESAQDAVRSNPSKALALCNDHARRFPKGSFAQEREAIAVEALARSGRKAEARARFERFKTSFPGSSHKPKLEALVAD